MKFDLDDYKEFRKFMGYSQLQLDKLLTEEMRKNYEGENAARDLYINHLYFDASWSLAKVISKTDKMIIDMLCLNEGFDWGILKRDIEEYQKENQKTIDDEDLKPEAFLKIINLWLSKLGDIYYILSKGKHTQQIHNIVESLYETTWAYDTIYHKNILHKEDFYKESSELH